jgi:hypothetical protein
VDEKAEVNSLSTEELRCAADCLAGPHFLHLPCPIPPSLLGFLYGVLFVLGSHPGLVGGTVVLFLCVNSNLFALCPDTPSDTHDTLRCLRCRMPESDDGDHLVVPPPELEEATEEPTPPACVTPAKPGGSGTAEDCDSKLARAGADAVEDAEPDAEDVDFVGAAGAGTGAGAPGAPTAAAEDGKKARGSRKRNRKSEEELAYEKAVREKRQQKMADVPPETTRRQLGWDHLSLPFLARV